MRKPHRKQLLAWLLTAVLLLTNFPISVLSEEIAENPIQAEATEQDEQEIAEEPNLSDFPTEETGEPTEPPVSEEPNEMPEPSEPSGTMEIPADENTPDIPDQDKSETPEPSDSDIEETPSPEDPEETPDTDSTDEPPVEETPIPEESPLPDDEEAFSVSEAILEYGYAYAAAYAESVIYEDTALTAPLFTLKEDGGVLLITEETETAFKVWWITYADEPLSGYIAKSDISDISFSEEARQTLKEQRPCGFITSDIGYMDAFVLLGELTISEEAPEATPAPEPQAPFLQAGDYAAVTTETRVYLSIDETMTEDDNGDDWQGVFTRNAVVSVESVQKDALGRNWCEVRYLFGADDADGRLIWTDTDTLFVPMDDLSPTDAHELTVTDYAYPFEPIALYASADFNLRNHNASVKTFYPGQQGLQGSSGHDSEYKQIAKLDGYGTIYATPHYLEGQTVYCLEHTMNSPGAKDNPTGPFEVVDLDGYAIKPGYSGDIYSSRTMHAIGWVLRHTYPYMIVDTGYEDSDVWSRVAGQFAIREIVKQLEGDWYVRDYWRMDEFYRASGQAPADYLEYARWLASCAIRRSGITGDIGISNKSMTMQGSSYVGTVTLTTDADLIRISRSVGSLTGNSAGSDGEYYYLRSGDTISVTSTQSTFAITAESVSSQDEEAAFLVGIPNADIQKVVIPQYGLPAKFKAVRIEFEQPYGAIVVTKTSASSGAALSGAVFELLNSAGAVLQSQTTGADGSATFSNVQAGTYTVREKNAPQGYQVSIQSSQTVTVTASATSRLSFANAPIQGKIRIVKTDSRTHEPLAGVVFTVTRLSAPAGSNGAAVGSVVAALTTGADGSAETDWLEWGRYRISEVQAPEHYADKLFSAELDCTENGKTYEIAATNEANPGFIRISKTAAGSRVPLAGIQFDIYYNDEYGSGLAGTMTTDENGVAISMPLRKGKYIVREHELPQGFSGYPVELTATIYSDETTRLSAENQMIQGKIRIVKTDSLTHEPLAGVQFIITRLSAPPSANGAGVGETILLTTNAQGAAETGWLDYGRYRIEETAVPAHYVDAPFRTEIDCFEGGKTYEIAAANEPTKGWLRLTKTDRKNGNPVAGVTFDIYENDAYGNALVGSMTTDENGVAVSEPLRKGRYLVREHGETAGYVFEEITLDATVKSDETTDLSATNQPVMTRIRIKKRDKDEYAQTDAPSVRGDGELIGATFRVLAGADILDRQGNVIWLRGATVIDAIQTSGEDAAATTDELWPGLYEIVEIAPPVGYLPSGEHVLVDTASAAAQSREAVITYDALKLNEIKLGAQAIVKVLGDNKTDNQHTETPEEGAEFHVYLRKAGSYENAREFERDHLITDKSGYAKTKLLPYGVYVLEQTVGKDGFEIKKPILFEITGEENLIQPPILTLNDRPILYRLRLIKTDARTGKTVTLAGASFKLKDADSNTVTQTVYYPKKQTLDTFTTDESGCVTLPEEVGWGLYSIEEIQAPEGYLIRTESLPVFVGKTGDTADQVYELDIEIPNEAVMGQIRLEKKGLQLVGFETQTEMGFEYQSPVFEERCLADAVFEVRAAEEIVGGDGTTWYTAGELVDTITTSGTGADWSKELPLGKYKLMEIAAPEGYALSDEVYEVDLKSIDGHTPLVTIAVKAHNEYLSAEIHLEKEKEILKPYTDEDGYIRQALTTTYGLGFVFGLYNADDIHYADGMLPADTLIAVGMTDMHGNLTFSGNLPHGAYTIRELDGPKGWKLNPNRFDVRISPENQADDAPVIRVSLDGTVRNELIYTKVTLTKTDITGAETVLGAEIEVKNEQGEVIYRAITDENGEIPDIPVTPGRYTFKEVLAPEGYALNETTCSFTVNENGHVSGDTVLRNDFTRFTLKKVGEHNEPLAGVEFSLKDERGAVVATALTDADGIAMFEKIPYGSYTVVESKPLPGYLPSGAQVTLTLDGTFVNPTEPIAVIPNERMKLTFKKVDTAGNPLAGISFTLIDAQSGTVAAHAVSDEKGEFEITGFTVGDWILREDEAPEGFNLMDDYPFHVGYNWKNDQTVTLVNIPNHYEFEKTDHRRKPLSGVRFGLYDDKGTFIRELVSDENGIVRADNLVPGSYLIREIRPLDGYARTDEAITFTIDESYIPPQKLARITNTPVIQTGVDFPIAPSMVVGLLMMAASVLLGLMRLLRKKHR